MSTPIGESEPAFSLRTRMRGVYFGYWLVGAAFIANFVAVGAQNYVFGAFFKPMSDELEWSRSAFTLARTVGQFFFAFAGARCCPDRAGWTRVSGTCNGQYR